MKHTVFLCLLFSVLLVNCKVLPSDMFNRISFFVETTNIPSSMNLEKLYVLNPENEQVGAGVAYVNNGSVQMSIPAEYAGDTLYMCAGRDMLTLFKSRFELRAGETVQLSSDDLGLGCSIPLPEVSNVLSKKKVSITNNSGASNPTYAEVFVTSLVGASIADAARDPQNNNDFYIPLLDAFSGQTLRFWVRFYDNDKYYYFYEDIFYNKGQTNEIDIKITYKGIPIMKAADLASALSNSQEDTHLVIVSGINLQGTPWTPVAFTGNLHGGGYKIDGIAFPANQQNLGFFSTVKGLVEDLTFSLATTQGEIRLSPGSVGYAGVVAGQVGDGKASVIRNVGVKTAAFSVAVNNAANVGGITGKLHDKSTIETSYCAITEIKVGNYYQSGGFTNTAADGINIGGIAGFDAGVISDSHHSGKITAQNLGYSSGINAGGLVGTLEIGTNVTNSAPLYTSYSTGNITLSNNSSATCSAGGLVGLIDASGNNGNNGNNLSANTISNCAATGASTITVSNNQSNSSFVGYVVGTLEPGNYSGAIGSTTYYEPSMSCSTGAAPTSTFESQNASCGFSSQSNLNTTQNNWPSAFTSTPRKWVWDTATTNNKSYVLVWQNGNTSIVDILNGNTLTNIINGLFGSGGTGAPTIPTSIP